MPPVGQLTAEMVLDDKGFSATVQKLDGVVTMLCTDLGALGENVAKIADGLAKGAGAGRGYSASMGEGEKAIRGFYKEQRLQDRVLKDSRESMMGFIFGLSALISGTDKGKEGIEHFEKSILAGMTAMEGAEFTATGLGVAGSKLGGVLGKTAGFLEKNAGMIGTVIGVGAGLITFFRDTNVEANKASEEGLKKFNEELGKIGPQGQAEAVKNAKATIERIKEQRQSLYELNSVTYQSGHTAMVRSVSRQNEAAFEQYTQDIELLEKFVKDHAASEKSAEEANRTEALLSGQLGEHKSKLQEIGEKLEANNKMLETGISLDGRDILSKERLRLLADQNLELEEEKNNLVMSSKGIVDKEVKLQDDKLKAGKITVDQYVNTLKYLETQLKKEGDRLELEIKIKDAIEAQKKKDKKEDGKDTSALEAIAGMAEYGKSLYEANKLTTEEYAAQLRLLAARAGESKEGLAIQKTLNDLLNKQDSAEEKEIDQIAAQYHLGKIDLQTAIDKLGVIQRTTTDILVQEKAHRVILNLQSEQIQNYDHQLDQIARVGDLLTQAFSKSGDNFIAKLNEALQVAIRIAKLLASANKKEGGADFTDYLESVSSVFGFLAALDAKPGTNPVPDIPDQATTDNGANSYRPAITPRGSSSSSDGSARTQMHLRPMVTVPKSFFASASMRNNDVLLRELQKMSAVLLTMSANTPVVIIKNPITLGKGLETEMSVYDSYKKNKYE